MPRFLIHIRGRNLHIKYSQQIQSFQSSLCLYAATVKEAEAEAKALIEEHPQLNSELVNPAEDPPLLFVEVQDASLHAPPIETSLPELNFFVEDELDLSLPFEDLFNDE